MSTQTAHYETFELTIGPLSSTGYPLSVIGSPGGDGAGICRLELDGELVDALAAIDSNDVDAGFLADIGAFLFEELFTGDIGELYRASMGAVRGQETQLRLRLHINAPELAALPWEYLHDPAEEHFFATSPETALVRYVPVRLPARPTKVELPLRILHLIANPSDAPQLDLAQERQIMESALQQWIDDGRIQLEVVEKATIASVTEAMRKVAPHVVHFAGHGFFDNDVAYIVLEDEAGKATPVDEKSFREFFSGSKETRLAVLNACQSATLSTAKPLVGIAPQLLQRQLSAVVAMQYPVSDQASLIFTREFYRSLAHGYPVDAAISEARKGIYIETGGQSREWGTPVLFMRAKDGVLFAIDEPEAAKIEIPPPPEPRRPPEIQGFVGREAELTAYAETLEQAHIAVIAGMAGVGKTALAAQLTHWVAEPERVFWHSFHEGEGVDSLIWNLAGFLAWHGKADLWNLLQSARLSGGHPPPSETLFDYVIQLTRGANYLLCFDDFQFVDDDPTLNQLVDRLREVLQAKEISLILTARRVPDFVTLAQFEPLPGLTSADARRLLFTNNLRLTDEQIDALYAHTDGNAEFLTLAIEALRQAKDPEVIIERLAATDDIERYLLTEVDEALTGQERAVMNAVSILLGYPGTRDVIDAVLNGPNVFRVLRRLTDRHLLIAQEGDKGREYLQHSMVQGFYYQQTGRSQRKRMHNRAGEFYRDEEPDLLQAGIHFERGGEVEEAARLATQDVLGIINRGQIRQLRGLLERFEQGQLAVEQWIEVNLAKGQVYTLQAEGELAERSLEEALAYIDKMADEPRQRILGARACRGMGELLEEKSPKDALAWFEQGVERLNGVDQEEEAALHIRSGTVLFFMSRYEDAEDASQRGLALLPSRPSPWRSIALRDLSGINVNLGIPENIQSYAREAVAICQQLNDRFHTTIPLMNLGIGLFIAGDIEAGLEHLNRSLQVATETGNEKVEAQILQNIGTAMLSMGEMEQAKEYLEKSSQLARKRQNQRILLYSLINLIELYIDEAEWELATKNLEEAEPLARHLDDQNNLMTLFGFWCEVALAKQDAEKALEYANIEWRMAVELGEIVQQGIGQADIGKALVAMKRYDEAFAAFEQSLALIMNEDRLQIALTQKDWGMALLAAKQQEEGVRMLAEARTSFRAVEALDEVEEINQILAPTNPSNRQQYKRRVNNG